VTPEAWGFFSVLTTTTSATVVQLVRLRRKVETSATTAQVAHSARASRMAAKAAARAAAEAADLARPTGNGFAGDVRLSLSEIKALIGELKEGQHELRQRLDQHIGDHAAADVRRR
jgi:hypothetical protein